MVLFPREVPQLFTIDVAMQSFSTRSPIEQVAQSIENRRPRDGLYHN